MAQVIKKENIVISAGEYQKEGKTKQEYRTIGELVTMQGDDGSTYQFGKMWGPTGATQFNVYSQEDKQQSAPIQQSAPAQQPVLGYYFANGKTMSPQEAKYYTDRSAAPWAPGTTPPVYQ